MKMECYEIVLERVFSQLGRIQQASVLQYKLYWHDGKGEFQLCRCTAAGSRQEQAQVQHLSSGQCRDLVYYLYENAVPMENWQDILHDLLAAI